jgi:hypothetical protein
VSAYSGIHESGLLHRKDIIASRNLEKFMHRHPYAFSLLLRSNMNMLLSLATTTTTTNAAKQMCDFLFMETQGFHLGASHAKIHAHTKIPESLKKNMCSA